MKTFHDLEQLAAEVQADHQDRLDPPVAETLVPRPHTTRPRPKTAIIAEAAKSMEWAEGYDA